MDKEKLKRYIESRIDSAVNAFDSTDEFCWYWQGVAVFGQEILELLDKIS